MWVSVFKTHSMNFDSLVRKGQYSSHLSAIAHEFGNFTAATTKLVIANADQPDLVKELARVPSGVKVEKISTQAVTDYKITQDETVFSFNKRNIYLPGLHPREAGISLLMVSKLLDYLGLQLDPLYGSLQLPPGRTNILKGIEGTTIIDSTYNNGLGAAKAMLDLFKEYPELRKRLVVADILEQGSLEKEEHELLAEEIAKNQFDKVVLLGKRTHQYTYPILKNKLPSNRLASFVQAGEVLDYLQKEITGGETILFKGALGLEGVIDQLLADPNDSKQLVRRGAAWDKRRKSWGLPK